MLSKLKNLLSPKGEARGYTAPKAEELPKFAPTASCLRIDRRVINDCTQCSGAGDCPRRM